MAARGFFWCKNARLWPTVGIDMTLTERKGALHDT